MTSILRKHVRAALAAIVPAAVLASCMLFPSVAPEGATDASFVRQAVPVLHGRKIRGYEETKLLVDLVQATNRETVLRALMAQPEFVDHWAEVLVDDLRVQREGFQAQFSCYGAPLRAGAPTDGIASTVLTQPPATAAAGGTFNMSDVVRSALVLDNVYPLYRAHLYAHMNTTPFATDELQVRDIRGAQFGETYLNRQMGCLICHNSEFSASGAASGWNRTYPILGLFEKALFGASTGEPTKNAYAAFRSDARFGPLSPWGLQSCGTYKTALANDPQNAIAHFVQPQGQQFGIHNLQGILQSGYTSLKANGLQRSLPAAVQQTCDFCDANCQGNTLSIEQAANNAPNAAQVKSLLVMRCSGCHGGAGSLDITNGNDWANDLIGVASSQKAGETRVIPGNANGSYLIKKLTGAAGIAGGQMPAGQAPLSSAQIDMIRDWINGLPALSACAQCATTDCGQLAQDLQGNEAFAYLVGARIVNNAWQEVFGTPVTIANYFPRHFEQRQVLWNLTEYNFLPNDWSLRSLLVRMMTSDMFNRVTPRSTGHATPYELPPVFDPWTVMDPRIPPVSDPGYSAAANPANHKNVMSEESYRYSARSLTNSVAGALGWPKPQRFPGGSYPDSNLMRAIGMFLSEEQPGFQTPDFAGLLAWETVHGQCANPTPASLDWISKVVVAVNNWDPATMGGPLTVEDAAITVRDWLLGYGGIGSTAPHGLAQTEREALQAHFGVANLSDPLTSVSGLEAKLRGLCGMHLQSPHFQLSGLVETGLGPKPRLRVCNTPECSYQQMCEALKPAVNALLPRRSSLLCGASSVTILTILRLPPLVDIHLCPPGICGVLDKFVNEGCPIFVTGAQGLPGRAAMSIPAREGLPGRCVPPPPACDPRCSQIDCCGGPLPLDFKQGDAMVAWADGAEVRFADGVNIHRRGANAPEPLRSGTRVAVGDLIALPPGSRMELRTKEGKILRTPEKGMARMEDGRVAVMMISGESALQTRRPDVAPPGKALPRERMLRVHASPWAARGEGGMLLTDERRVQFKYSEHEMKAAEQRRRELMSGPATKR